ncbi:MAG: hypothetical protein RLZZ104_566 [Pseudomonadota bacterium]|jgi:hypothetical protein
MTAIFGDAALASFAGNYPEAAHKVEHDLRDHPLLTLDALARLGESLPAASVEYNRGDLPTGVDPESDIANGLSIGDTIRHVDSCRSWAVLKNIEQMPDYRDLLLSLLGELKPLIEAKTGAMLMPQGFVFVSSPQAVTPYHFDPEHNILLQLKGSKTMTQFPAGDPRFAPDETHEGYHTGGHRNLIWRDELAAGGTPWTLVPGEAVFVPVMAPHHVKVGPDPSISLSITWRSDWSYAEADARAFNHLLRKAGLRPRAPGRYPAQNRLKAYGWRIVRKLRKAG